MTLPNISKVVMIIAFASAGAYLLGNSLAASSAPSAEAESGTLSGNASVVANASASGGNAVKFGAGVGTLLSCANPVYTATWPQDQYAGYGKVQNDILSDGGGPSTDFQTLNVCSDTNWNVVANWGNRGGSIESYADTNYDFTDKTISQYNSIQTCFAEKPPIPGGPKWPTTGGNEYDYAYDVWINYHTGEDVWSNDIEIMVWNDYTDTSIYPPSFARAVTIDGIAYHMFQAGAENEWIYIRDIPVTSGCFDMLNIMKDLVAHPAGGLDPDHVAQGLPSTSGITNTAAPQHLEYGVEISGTYGTQTFQITNATMTAN